MISCAANGGKSDEDLSNFLNQFGNLISVLQKKANPNDEFAQLLLILFNTMLSFAKNKIGGGQEVHVDTLLYTAKRYDQRMTMESVDENAAMVEDDMDLTRCSCGMLCSVSLLQVCLINGSISMVLY